MRRRHHNEGPLKEGELYVGRGRRGVNLHSAKIGEYGWLGNPYDVLTFGREESVEMFRKALKSKLLCNPEFAKAFYALRGKYHTVVCWCKSDQKCHGDIIADLLTGEKYDEAE